MDWIGHTYIPRDGRFAHKRHVVMCEVEGNNLTDQERWYIVRNENGVRWPVSETWLKNTFTEPDVQTSITISVEERDDQTEPVVHIWAHFDEDEWHTGRELFVNQTRPIVPTEAETVEVATVSDSGGEPHDVLNRTSWYRVNHDTRQIIDAPYKRKGDIDLDDNGSEEAVQGSDLIDGDYSGYAVVPPAN